MSYRALFVCAVFGSLSCITEAPPTTKGGNSCSNSADCEEGTLCLDDGEIKQCVEIDCLSSTDCSFQQYCTSDFECVTGCEQDTDCQAGQQCNLTSGVCEYYGCRSTDLDCAIGEICNVPTGTCVQDTTQRCSLCSSDDVYYTPPSDGICLVDSYEGSCTVDISASQQGCLSTQVCFPNDVDAFLDAAAVFDFTPQAGTCVFMSNYLYCNQAEDCPRGFSCSSIPYTDGTFSDPVCLGDCGYFREEGYY